MPDEVVVQALDEFRRHGELRWLAPVGARLSPKVTRPSEPVRATEQLIPYRFGKMQAGSWLADREHTLEAFLELDG
jgi:hypothetical protein